MADRLDYIFDSNAIRNLALLPEPQWERLCYYWGKKHLRTMWIPWTISEVLGTGLSRKSGPVPAEEFPVFQRAIRRFDVLADRRVLPGVRSLIRASVFELADTPDPGFDVTEELRDWRMYLDTFVRAIGFEDITIRPEQGELVIEIRPRGNEKEGHAIRIPTIFEAFANDSIDSWSARIPLNLALTEEQQIELITGAIVGSAPSSASRLRVPRVVIDRALQPERSVELFQSAIGIRLAVEFTYYQQRALGRMERAAAPAAGNYRFRIRIEDDDAADIAVSTYLGVATTLVTDDGKYTKFLRHLLATPDCVCSLSEFLDRVAPSAERTRR